MDDRNQCKDFRRNSLINVMAFLKAISYYLPEASLSNAELAAQFPNWQGDKFAAKVGIDSRHIAAEDETAGDMAEKAARKLFSEHGISPDSVDFLLLCTQSPDYFLPTTACILQSRLGIPTTAGAFDYNLGCSGAIYGLAIAKGLISSRVASNVLLITSETYSKYIHPSDNGNRSIFGDGAAACLVSTEGFAEIGDFVLGTDGSHYRDLIVATGASRCPSSNGKETTDEEGHVRRDDFLYMNGGEILNFTLDVVPPMVEQVLEKNGIQKQDVGYYVFHQANKFILKTLRTVCNIPKECFYINLNETGNTVSPTVFIALKDCIDGGVITKGQNVMIAGFGVGLSWGGTILRFK